jgi:hypothetical protein
MLASNSPTHCDLTTSRKTKWPVDKGCIIALNDTAGFDNERSSIAVVTMGATFFRGSPWYYGESAILIISL